MPGSASKQRPPESGTRQCCASGMPRTLVAGDDLAEPASEVATPDGLAEVQAGTCGKGSATLAVADARRQDDLLQARGQRVGTSALVVS